MATKTTQVEVPSAALAYAKHLHRKNYGPVTIVRATTQHFPHLKRRAMLAIAKNLNLNLGTTARQYQEVRSGLVKIEEL